MADRTPFEPLGPRARWRIVYDHLKTQPVGATATYEELGELLNLEPLKDRAIIQDAARRAGLELLRADNHAIVAVVNTGYRIVEANEHLTLAKVQQKRSARALDRGYLQVSHVDLSGMDVAARRVFDVVGRALSAQIEFNRRMDVRQTNLEKVVGAVAGQADKTSREVEDLRARLNRLETERRAAQP